MELNFSSLEIVGYHNQQVPNTFISHLNPGNHLGIILPGYRYSVDMPPLHYTQRILLDQGADTLSVDYVYSRTDFMKQPENKRDEWISADIFAACNTILSQHPYEKITLVGKSLGTIAMGHLLADRRFQQASCIWLTPLLTTDRLRTRIEQIHPRSLFVIGTADQFYQPGLLHQLESTTNSHALVIQDADHSLEIPNDIQKSLTALNLMIQAIQDFLYEGR